MAHKHLATYLNDHLAGSVAALELLAHLEAAQTGTEVARVTATLRADIAAEQRELEALMGRLHITQSPARQAVAWLGEKITLLKLRLDDPADGALHLFEALEAIAVGIQGKRGLWRALAAAAVPGLQVIDYERLALRSEEQHQRVEEVRLEAAKMALSDVLLADDLKPG